MLFGKHLDEDDEDDEDDDDEIEDDVDDDLVQNTFRPLKVSQAVHFDWTGGRKGCFTLLTFLLSNITCFCLFCYIAVCFVFETSMRQ